MHQLMYANVDPIDWRLHLGPSGDPVKIAFFVATHDEVEFIKARLPEAEINQISQPDASRLVVVNVRFGTPVEQLKANLRRFGEIESMKALPAKNGDRRPPLQLVTFEKSADAAKILQEGLITVCGNHLRCRPFMTGGRQPRQENEEMADVIPHEERPAVFLYGVPAFYKDVDVNAIKTSIGAITWKANRCRNHKLAVHFVMPSEATRDALLGESISVEGRLLPFLSMKPCFGCGRTDHQVDKCPVVTAEKVNPPAPVNAPAPKKPKAASEINKPEKEDLAKMIQEAVTAATAPLLKMLQQFQAELARRDETLKAQEESIHQLMELFEEQSQELMEEDIPESVLNGNVMEKGVVEDVQGNQHQRKGASRQAKENPKAKPTGKSE